MECVIIYRYADGAIGFIYESEDNPERMAVFKDRDEAIAFALNHHWLQQWPYQIVELDEI